MVEKTEIEDQTQIDLNDGKKSGAEPDTEVIDDSSSSEPFDKNPKWIEMAAKGKSIDGILEEHGFDSLEELKGTLTDSTNIKSVIGDLDAEGVYAMLKEANEMQRTKSYWASQEEKSRLEELDPDDRVKELELENSQLRAKKKTDEEAMKQAMDAENNIRSYEKNVISFVKEDTSIPEVIKPFITKYLGAKHPMNDISDDNLADTKEIQKMIKIASEDSKALINSIIKNYRDGKLEAPDITSIESSPIHNKKEIKNIDEAGKALAEILTSKFNK
jgi:hypothetical protein